MEEKDPCHLCGTQSYCDPETCPTLHPELCPPPFMITKEMIDNWYNKGKKFSFKNKNNLLVIASENLYDGCSENKTKLFNDAIFQAAKEELGFKDDEDIKTVFDLFYIPDFREMFMDFVYERKLY